jgi:hypothetical protein
MLRMVTGIAEASTETRREFVTLEAAHRSRSSFDPPMILIDSFVYFPVKA